MKQIKRSLRMPGGGRHRPGGEGYVGDGSLFVWQRNNIPGEIGDSGIAGPDATKVRRFPAADRSEDSHPAGVKKLDAIVGGLGAAGLIDGIVDEPDTLNHRQRPDGVGRIDGHVTEIGSVEIIAAETL